MPDADPPAQLAAELASAIIELAPDGILVVDADGTIRFANPAAGAVFSCPHRALVGMAVESLLPERVRPAHVQHRADYEAAPRPRPMGVGLDLVALRADGTEVPVQISLSPAHLGASTGTIAMVREMTEQRVQEQLSRMHMLIEERDRIAAALHNRVIERLFSAGMGLQSVLRIANSRIAASLGEAVDQLDQAIHEIRHTVFTRTVAVTDGPGADGPGAGGPGRFRPPPATPARPAAPDAPDR